MDRFSPAAATLFERTSGSGFPGPNEPIDFDVGPFVTVGLGPDGSRVTYYNFDIQSATPAPIYVLVRDGETGPVAGQLNVIDLLPGDPGYNDFWQVVRVRVPRDYVPNTVTSLEEIIAAGYTMELTSTLVNCPVVPAGSTARLRLEGEGSTSLRGWYRGRVVHYFAFGEAPLAASGGQVPQSGIYVTFNTNPDQPGGGPPSGFRTEPGSSQTHNVLSTLPGDPGYSPLWTVVVYDNADFDAVRDLATAQAATLIGQGGAVNCPVVARE